MHPQMFACWFGVWFSERQYQEFAAADEDQQADVHVREALAAGWGSSRALRQRLGSLLVRTGQRLQGAPLAPSLATAEQVS